jgi:hypothetical protein
VSSILKALQRVEQEQPSGAAASAPRRAVRGDFVAKHGAPLLRRARRRVAGAPLWGALGAVLLVAAFVWWRLPESSRPELPASEAKLAAPSEAQPETVAEPASGAPVADAALPAAPEPPAAAEPRPEPAPPPALAAAPAPAEDAAPAVPSEVAERLPPLGTTLDVPDAAPPPPAPEPAAEVARAEPEPAPPPEPKRAEPVPPRPAPAVKRAAPKPAPPRSAAVAPASPPRPSAPAVLVERTRWHPSADRRVAWVSVAGQDAPRELHEGDAVGALVVKEIRPSSVLFLHGADTLSRRVGVRE